MNVKRILICGVVLWAASLAFGWLTCGWLFNWVYAIPPNIWKDPAVITSAANLIPSSIIALIQSILFALVFAVLYKGIPGTGVKKGLIYGLLVWLVGAGTGIAALPFAMTIAATVVIYWIIQALVFNLIGGAILAAIYKPK